MEDGGWRMEDGGWRMEGGGWEGSSSKFVVRGSGARWRLLCLSTMTTAPLSDLQRLVAESRSDQLGVLALKLRGTMSEIRNYRDLEAWQVAMEMVDKVYTISARFPSHERFGLTSQIRRAAVSVASNIAEGQGHGLTRACLHYLRIALGSLAEIDTQLEVAIRRNYCTRQQCEELDRLLTSSKRLTAALRRAKAVRLGMSAGSLPIVAFTLACLR